MASSIASTAFDRGVSPLLQVVLLDKADAVLSFQPDPALRDRIEVLASKANEGELSEEERAEYEGYVRANKFIAIIRRQARRLLGAEPQPLGRTTVRVLNVNGNDQLALRSS